jgi:hypothetical protein
MAVNQRQDLGNGRYIQVDWLVFAPDGLRVYLEARHSENWPGDPSRSCLVWAGSNSFEGVTAWNWYKSPYVTEGLYVYPTLASMQRLEPPANTEGGPAFYRGYLVFPYEVFPYSAGYLRHPGGYYLSYACKVDSGQIPLMVMTDYQSWTVTQRLDYYPGGAQAREQAERANSFMVLESLEHEVDSADVQVRLGIVLDAGSREFITDAPGEVYLEAGGQRFPATSWGGLFKGAERIDGISWGIYGDAYPGPGWIRFAGAWEAIHSADCFNLRYGNTYLFDNICLSALMAQGGQTVVLPTPSPATIEGVYSLISALTGQCVDVPGGTSDDVDLILWGCHGDANQQWRLQAGPDGYWYLVAVGSGKCMDVRGADQAAGARVMQAGCNWNENQQWQKIDVGNGRYQFQARHSGLCLAVELTEGGDPHLVQQACAEEDGQWWEVRAP